jgi:hypothetical protein
MIEVGLERRPFRQRVQDARSRAATTPGHLRVVSWAIALVTAGLVVIGVGTLATALATVNRIHQSIEPSVVGMAHVHAWLSDADRSAASAYLSGGFDPTSSQLQFDAVTAATNLDLLGRMNPDDPQLRYQADIAATSRQLQRATDQTSPGDEANLRLHAIAVAISNYTSLVNTAASSQTSDIAAGSVYLQASSNLIHGPGGILDQVDQMRDLYTSDLDQANLTLEVTAGMLVIFAIAAMVLLWLLLHTQRFLRFRFRRRRNPRLALATLLLGLVCAGVGVGSYWTIQAVRAAESDSYPRLLKLWDARALVYDANSSDISSLIQQKANRSTAQSDQAFQVEARGLVDRPLTTQMIQDAASGQVGFNGALADEVRGAGAGSEQDAIVHGLTAYQQFLQADAALRAPGAAPKPGQPKTKTPDASLVASTDQVDWYLGAAMDSVQSEFDATMSQAELTLTLTLGLVVVGLLIAALTFWGLRPRLAEYSI